MKKLFLFLSLILLTNIVRADIPRPEPSKTPKPEKETSAQLFISVRSETKEPTLIINRSTLKQLRAALDEAETDQDYAENESSFSRSQMLVSGMFFSFAFIVGGVWMFRSKGKSSKTAMILLVFAAIGAGTTVVFANAPPPEVVSLTSRIFNKSTKLYGYARGNIKIKISDDGDDSRILLSIPKAENDPDLK